MKIKERVLILCVSLILLGAGVGVIYRFALGEDEWQPSDIYNNVGGSPYSVVSGGHSSSDGLAVSLVSGMRSSRRVSAPAFTSARSGDTSASATQSAAVAGGALYATSSASYRTFGGGMSSGSGASGMGAVQAPRSEMSVGASAVSIPSVSMPSRSLIAMEQSARPEAEMALQSIVEGSQGMRSISGRKNAPPSGGGYVVWLEDQYIYTDEAGNWYFNMKELEQAFYEAKSKGHFPGMEWDDFKAQFFADGSKYRVPVGEAWALLAMVMVYALVMIIKAWVNKCKTAPMA